MIELAAEVDWIVSAGENLWAFLLVAIGIGLVVSAIGGAERRGGRKEASHE
jgi:hypothetical protein